jgi:hypothetical protein
LVQQFPLLGGPAAVEGKLRFAPFLPHFLGDVDKEVCQSPMASWLSGLGSKSFTSNALCVPVNAAFW